MNHFSTYKLLPQKSIAKYVVKTFSLLSFFFLFASTNASEEFKLLKSIDKSAAAQVTTDKFGNIYVYERNELTQYNPEYSIKTFTKKEYGTISLVDASNPLKIMLYYADFGQIIYLDKNLSPIGDPISINDLGFYNIRIICSSSNEGFWIFDETQKQILHINNQLQTDKKTGNLELMFGSPFKPSSVCEQNQMLWVSVPEKGVILLDAWGTYIKTIPIKGLDNFQTVGESIFYFQNNKIHSYQIRTLETTDLETPNLENILNIRIGKNIYYVITKNKIDIFQLSL